MDWLTMALRVIHIAAGVFWVGAAFTFFLFVQPSASALGPNAAAFMQQMNVKRRFPQVVIAAAALTVIAGGVLYWRVTGGLRLETILTPIGLSFTTGGITATIAFLVAAFGVRPRVNAMSAIGGRLAAEGRPPTAEEAAELGQLQRSARSLGLLNLVLLTVAVVTMAAARYLGE